MAVTNFHYITRMSSGFKVYILEGQPHLRSEDRFHHMTSSERIRVAPSHPLKRKHILEPGRTLEERRERVLSKSRENSARISSKITESPTSTWSPTASPIHLIPSPIHCTQVMDEPLALIKKAHREPENTEDKSKTVVLNQIQARPTVITCVSSPKSTSRSEDSHSHSTVITQHSYDNVEEHFKRSLGVNYQNSTSRQLSISVSVDDHFAKALGEKWVQLKSSSSCNRSSSKFSSSSSPPSSSIFIHSLGSGKSSKKACKSSVSPTSSSMWAGQ